MGQQSQGTNTIYRKLVSNLMDSPTSPFLIRIGGGSTDGATTPFSVQALNELNAALPGITFTAGVYMGGTVQSSPSIGYAENQAQSYISGMTPGILSSIEIGNETDNYQYIKAAGRAYTFDVFNSQFSEWVSGIRQTTGTATPTFTGGSWALMRTLLNDNYWSNYVNEPPSYLELFIDKQKPNLGTVTQHFYAGMEPGTFPPSYLLSSGALQYKNPGETVPYWVPGVLGSAAALAHENGMTFRVNEMNSVDGGGVPGTSDSFAAALWAIDTMFEFASAGVDGVNWHGATGGVRNVTPGSTCTVEGVTEQAPCTPDPIYAPFTFLQTRQTNGSYSYSLNSVNPLYYGLYFFHLAVPDGSQSLPVTLQSPSAVKVWATKDSLGTIRIAIINKDTAFNGTVSISLAGYRAAQTLLLKDANGYQGSINYATSTAIVGTTGITIAGQTFDGSVDGSIQGTPSLGSITPVNGVYDVPMQSATAMLLVIPQ
jgi:hypothetical protein